MSQVYTFVCPHCEQMGCNVWTRDGSRWYFLAHAAARPVWNGSAWVPMECPLSNRHVPLGIAVHMRRVYRDADPRVRRWYHGRTTNDLRDDDRPIAPGCFRPTRPPWPDRSGQHRAS